MSLKISNLKVSVSGKEILNGINLEIQPGEVHAVMGPNGAGKSTLSNALMGKPGYVVDSGEFSLDDQEMFSLETWERAKAGLFLAMQYPTEVPGVSTQDMLSVALEADVKAITDLVSAEADRIGYDKKFLDRPLNVDLSGGEKKRNETLQLGIIKPKYAILDELDSGLDIDALQAVSERVEQATTEANLGVLVITHYNRLLSVLKPDFVHVLADGKIVETGGFELAESLEETGYAAYA